MKFQTQTCAMMVSAIALMAAAPAMAAEAPAKDSNGEIIVTAQRTVSVASKTPISLTVIAADELRQRGVSTVADLRNMAPALEIGNASQGPNISVRGLGSTDLSSKGKQGVVFTVDNIPVGRPQMMGSAFFDLERVEVLRGPQGTLYGKNATAGVINLITARPKDVLEARATVELGNFNTMRGEGMVNLPVTSNWAVRAAGSVNRREGYLLPVLGQKALGTQANLSDENNWNLRLSSLLKFADTGRFLLTGTFGHVGGTGDVSNGMLYSRWLSTNGSGSAYARQVYYNPMAGKLNDRFANVNAEISFDVGAVNVTYDGAHLFFKARDNKFASTGDPAGAGGTANYTWSDYRADITLDSHEIRLSNAKPGKLSWVVGGNYWKEKIDEQDMNWQTLTGTATCSAPTLSAACNNPNPHIIGPTGHKSTGLFGQSTYEVVDGLKLTAGLRYSKDSLYRNAMRAAGGAPAAGWLDAFGKPCAPPNYCANGTPNVGAQEDSKLTWRLGVDYQITPRQMVYGSIATGYKAGGFNDVDPTTTNSGTGTYGAEQLTAYEVGYKGRVLPNLQFNSSVYYYDYSKYQFTGVTFLAALPGLPTGVLIYTTLVPAKAYGWENELNWTPTKHDRVMLTSTLAEGHYSAGPQVGFIYSKRQDWTGYRFDRLPKFTLSGSYEHTFELKDGARIIGRVNSRYSSGYLVSDTMGDGNPFAGVYSVMPAQYRQGAFTRTDLSLAYESENGKLRLEGFVRNLENKVQLLGSPNGINPAGVGTADRTTVRVSEPRMFGARLTVKY
ncbi:hypothetical protein EOE18_08075 [Novosphingobium umbonatum]|uniref:TonB-dependent receptor n=1 Tax=Novosphingobium umbonatum TaxID=1908524 RepID=A0A437N7L6_9SPHN|nr:TonB-dependent receptor [Novosphingobium umbonatum]RVU05910.1 hypothetical protein EOE18_08075 [Novosphingobium umbonatum]